MTQERLCMDTLGEGREGYTKKGTEGLHVQWEECEYSHF